ncbi:MAG: ABC transporter ATP-binding protein [Propionibacteriaceae bacterium]|nr:ABC transporter ATP-binding protein [Propionibacteriaceae bacterium]
MNTVVEASGLLVDYPVRTGSVHALRGVDFRLAAGESVCLFGASGSGKSTLLNVLAGLDLPDQGSLRVCGEDVIQLSDQQRTALRLRSVGMVFQDNNLVAQFTAAENVELILRCQGVDSPRSKALELLAAVGVDDLADRQPVDMSGGQRQRVGIARALAGEREVILCDEPTGALDRENSNLLFDLLRELTRTKAVGVLIATHDQSAAEYADRVLEISDGQLVSR